MSEKKVNIIDIIEAIKQKNYSFLNEIGDYNEEKGYFDVNDDVNVFYELNEEDLNATIDYDGFELSDASNKKPHTINDIYYIEFNENYIYFEFTGRSLFLKIQYNTSTGKQIEVEKEVSYFYINDQEYKFYLDDNIVCNFLESV